MRIERYLQPGPQSLEEFANLHDLILEMRERGMEMRKSESRPLLERSERFYASFRGIEIVDGNMLVSASGNGETEDEAICDYCVQIQGKQLVKDAGLRTRKTFQAPDVLTWWGGAE